MKAYIHRHIQVFFSALGDVCRTPLTSLSTIFVIAFSFALPLIFYILLTTAQNISGNWQGQPQLNVYLQTHLDSEQAKLIFAEIQLMPEIAEAEFISSQDGLAEFTRLSKQQWDFSIFDNNPIPASIIIVPESAYLHGDKLNALKHTLSKIDGIESLHYDLEWLQRFNSFIFLLERINTIIGLLLLFIILLVISNNIKLLVLNRKDEIEIMKLVGGSDAFVRRPFLYFGTLYGVLGAILAFLIVHIVHIFLAHAVQNLSQLYLNQVSLYSLSLTEKIYIFLFAAALGCLAARVSVAVQLFKIQAR